MPRAKKVDKPTSERPTSTKQIEPEWGGFLNLKLDDADRERFDAWLEEHGGRVGAFLDDALIAGLKFSLSNDAENECYIATLTGLLIPSHNTRYAASARAGTVSEATALICYKHFVLAEGNWFDFLPHNGKLQRWG